jgi:hypothetical protein
MVTSAKIVGLVEFMEQNLSRGSPPSLKVKLTGEDAQALLRQLMAITMSKRWWRNGLPQARD